MPTRLGAVGRSAGHQGAQLEKVTVLRCQRDPSTLRIWSDASESGQTGPSPLLQPSISFTMQLQFGDGVGKYK